MPAEALLFVFVKKKGQKVDSHYHDVAGAPFPLYYTVCWPLLRSLHVFYFLLYSFLCKNIYNLDLFYTGHCHFSGDFREKEGS